MFQIQEKRVDKKKKIQEKRVTFFESRNNLHSYTSAILDLVQNRAMIFQIILQFFKTTTLIFSESPNCTSICSREQTSDFESKLNTYINHRFSHELHLREFVNLNLPQQMGQIVLF